MLTKSKQTGHRSRASTFWWEKYNTGQSPMPIAKSTSVHATDWAMDFIRDEQLLTSVEALLILDGSCIG